MIQTVKNILKSVPRSGAESNPKVYEEDGRIYVRCGSSNFACRAVQALRGAGLSCKLTPYDWRIIAVY